jgi:hypothetical protein
VGAFEFLRRRPLEKGDDERVRDVHAPLNADGRFLLQRCLDGDGTPRLVRVIDIRDRHTDEQEQHLEEVRTVARLLLEAGFDVYETPMSRSEWGDLEIHECS